MSIFFGRRLRHQAFESEFWNVDLWLWQRVRRDDCYEVWHAVCISLESTLDYVFQQFITKDFRFRQKSKKDFKNQDFEKMREKKFSICPIFDDWVYLAYITIAKKERDIQQEALDKITRLHVNLILQSGATCTLL
jgi:hypothetical protein